MAKRHDLTGGASAPAAAPSKKAKAENNPVKLALVGALLLVAALVLAYGLGLFNRTPPPLAANSNASAPEEPPASGDPAEVVKKGSFGRAAQPMPR